MTAVAAPQSGPGALRMLATDLRILLLTTTSIWWRLLPRLLALHLIGALGFQLAQKAAVVIGQASAWAALVVFSFGFLAELGAIVVSLRLIGRELHIGDLVAGEDSTDDDRDSSVGRLLAVTLLPFLGLYAAFGYVQDESQQLLAESVFVSGGALGVQTSILGQLRLIDAPPSKIATVVAVIVGCYLLRRGLDALHERTGWRPLGLLVAGVEGFFILATLIAGADLVARVTGWVRSRAFAAWIEVVTDGIAAGWAAVVAALPSPLVAVVTAVREQFWDVVLDEVTQPIIWLAVAALIYGSRVISVAELWRKGRPLVRRADRDATRLAHRPHPGPPSRLARVGQEVRELVLGDLDDKYLPTVHSLRLVVRAGVVFLGAYLLAYALQAALAQYWEQVVDAAIGGRDITFWITWNPVIDLVLDLPLEPWRLCLLGVAFARCLQIFRARAELRGLEAVR